MAPTEKSPLPDLRNASLDMRLLIAWTLVPARRKQVALAYLQELSNEPA